MNLLGQIMNHGMIIWEKTQHGVVVVQKIKTVKSPTDVLHNEIGSDCSIKEFPSHDVACEFCRKFIENGIEEANLTECQVQLGYNPTGLAMKMKTLDNVRAASYEEAMKMANQQAVAFFEKRGIAKKIGDNFEVKVIPV